MQNMGIALCRQTFSILSDHTNYQAHSHRSYNLQAYIRHIGLDRRAESLSYYMIWEVVELCMEWTWAWDPSFFACI